MTNCKEIKVEDKNVMIFFDDDSAFKISINTAKKWGAKIIAWELSFCLYLIFILFFDLANFVQPNLISMAKEENMNLLAN